MNVSPLTYKRLTLGVGALIAFMNPEVRAVVGAAPLVEFFVLGSIAAAASLLRPAPEAPPA